MEEPGYDAYVLRHETAQRFSPGARKLLPPERFHELAEEHRRLIRRMDPADIQLDEWKRMEELRFLLILAEDAEEE